MNSFRKLTVALAMLMAVCLPCQLAHGKASSSIFSTGLKHKLPLTDSAIKEMSGNIEDASDASRDLYIETLKQDCHAPTGHAEDGETCTTHKLNLDIVSDALAGIRNNILSVQQDGKNYKLTQAKKKLSWKERKARNNAWDGETGLKQCADKVAKAALYIRKNMEKSVDPAVRANINANAESIYKNIEQMKMDRDIIRSNN